MTADISERALETRIMRRMPSVDGLTYDGSPVALDPTDALAATKAVGSGWFAGNPRDYDRTHALDVPQRFGVLHATQAGTFQKPGVVWYQDGKDIHWQKDLGRLPSEIGKRGVIDVPLQGLAQGPLNLDLSHGTASPGHGRSPRLGGPNDRSRPCRSFSGPPCRKGEEAWAAWAAASEGEVEEAE
jgi:type I restriction enzyme R subunit